MSVEREHFEDQSRKKNQQQVDEYFSNPTATKLLGGGRLGNLQDAHNENMLDPNGLYLGFLEGQPIFYNGDAHLLNYGMTRSGKGRDIILPNLAHVFDRSIIVNDIKDGENAYASAGIRKQKGQRIIPINPHGLLGIKSFKLNPFQRIIDHAQAGINVSEDVLQIILSIVPTQNDKNAWVGQGAQEILATWLEWCAIFRPEKCNLTNMWRFIFREFDCTMDLILNCGIERLEGNTEGLAMLAGSPDQWNAYIGEIKTALRCFAPDTPLGIITEKSNFDPASLCHETTTVYLMANSDLLESAGRWMSLTISAIINTCAQTHGDVKTLFMIDELANLPYMAIIPKALTLYAGKGVQIWGFCQGREALRDRGYTDNTIKNFESQSGIFHMWTIKDTSLIKDIEIWSGNKAVAIKGINSSGGAVDSTSMSLSEHKRPVLQSEDILSINERKQIIRTTGAHLFVADRVPWFEMPALQGRLLDVRKMHEEPNYKAMGTPQKKPVLKLPPPE